MCVALLYRPTIVYCIFGTAAIGSVGSGRVGGRGHIDRPKLYRKKTYDDEKKLMTAIASYSERLLFLSNVHILCIIHDT